MRPFAEWLARCMAARRIGPRQVEIGMRARGFRTSRSMISAYARDEVVPPMEKAENLAAYFESELEEVRDLVRRSRPASPPMQRPVDQTREIIRLTVTEMLDQMARRRDRPPADASEDPVLVQMLVEINAELATMTEEEIAEVRRTWRQDLQRHRRTQLERLGAGEEEH